MRFEARQNIGSRGLPYFFLNCALQRRRLSNQLGLVGATLDRTTRLDRAFIKSKSAFHEVDQVLFRFQRFARRL